MAVDAFTDWSRPSLTESLFAWNERRPSAVLGVAGVVVFLATWAIAAWSTNPSYVLPGPVATATAFVALFTDTTPLTLPLAGRPVRLPVGVAKLLQSLTHYVPGLVVGATLGICLGITTALSDRADAVLSPVVRFLRPIPPLAWMAFALVWFGIHHAGAAFIVFIGAFWINFYGAYSGVENVPDRLPEVAASLGVTGRVEMVRRVVLPSAAPQVITSFRTSVGRCWMILVGAELFGAPGVGYEIINAANNLAMDTSLAYMLLVSLAFIAMDVTVRGFERRVLAWR